MAGLNAALSVAAQSLDVFTAGINVAGSNISNANSPGYVREQLDLSTNFPSKIGDLIFGNGVTATGIRQQIDKYLEKRIYSANADYAGANARDTIYKQLETAVNALGDSNLSTGLNDFLAKINDVVNLPEDAATRQLAVFQGVQFAQSIVNLRGQIDDLRTAQGAAIQDQVSEANKLIDDIARLNPRIISLEGGGALQSDAGDLRNQRYADLNRLSQILPIKTVEQPSGEVDVYLGSEPLVTAGSVQHLETTLGTDRGTSVLNVRIEGTTTLLSGTQGSLNGILNGRDAILGGFEDQLDKFTSSVIFEFNKIHASGQGTHGFSTVTSTNAASDVNASLDSGVLPFTPVNGSFQIKVINKSTGEAQTTTVPVDLTGTGTNATLTSLNAALNGIANVSASIAIDGRLTISAGSGYEIQFGNDTSGALAALGINTFFTGTGARDIGVNAQVTSDPGLFATRRGGGPGDGSNAALLAAIADNPDTALGGMNLRQYYNATVSTVGQSSASESALAAGAKGFQDSLLSQRAQISGVSLDEEAIQIMKFQHAYQASAKFISTIDQLLTLLTQI